MAIEKKIIRTPHYPEKMCSWINEELRKTGIATVVMPKDGWSTESEFLITGLENGYVIPASCDDFERLNAAFYKNLERLHALTYNADGVLVGIPANRNDLVHLCTTCCDNVERSHAVLYNTDGVLVGLPGIGIIEELATGQLYAFLNEKHLQFREEKKKGKSR